MTEYRDMIVVFMALALVAFLILIAANVQGPIGEGLGEAQAAKPKEAAMRIRFGEPVIDVKGIKEDALGLEAEKKKGTEKGTIYDVPDEQMLTFSEYVFPINANGMRKAIESISPALGECYQQWLSLDDSVGYGAWEATYYFKQSQKIEKTSSVTDIRLAHPSPDSEVMEQCLLEMFRMLRFEENGPRVFKHPLVFQERSAQ